jgi:predicted secreted hydrolase
VSPLRHVVIPQAPRQELLEVPSIAPVGGMTRRGVVRRALVTGAGAALAAAGGPGLAAAQNATPVSADEGSTIETVSGQALYSLPRDHRWHGGPFYTTGEYWEWHYWTGFVTDVDSGDEWGLFYTTMRNAFIPETGEPAVINFVSLTDFATSTFYPASRGIVTGGERATRPADGTSPDDFEYAIDSGDGLSIVERYYHDDERWGFQLSYAPTSEQAALEIGVELVLEAPGYLPTTPTGIEEEGYSREGLYNPETMYGLSYYYFAPKMALTGTITAGDETHQVEGTAWLEHQWGNYSTEDPEAYRWRWGSVRFDDGSGINWRQWERGPDNAAVFDLNHYAIYTAEGAVRYGYGRDLTYEVISTWVSPHTGRHYGLYGLLRTPVGTFYVSPMVEDQEILIPGMTVPLWEGAMEVRRDSSDGELVGRMYMEELFNDPGLPVDGPLARQLPPSGVN